MQDQKTKAKRTKKQQSAEKNNVTPIDRLKLNEDVPHTYDVDNLEAFIDMVFHTEIPEGEHRLFYAGNSPTRGPGMPFGEGWKRLETIARRTNKGRMLYFNASTVTPDYQGVLRHKRSQFAAFHVLVLDDIGTKIPVR